MTRPSDRLVTKLGRIELPDPEVVVHYAVAFVAVSEPLVNAITWQLVRLPVRTHGGEDGPWWHDAGDPR